jgi:hypothetical protein
MVNYKRVKQESLQVGDILHLIWCGDKHILRFEEYKDVFDFVARVARFTDGTAMSLTKGDSYEIVEV